MNMSHQIELWDIVQLGIDPILSKYRASIANINTGIDSFYIACQNCE